MDAVAVEFVESIANAICTKPADVEVTAALDNRGIMITMLVDESDIGRVIGKGGAGAEAIRLLLRTMGAINNAHFGLKVDIK